MKLQCELCKEIVPAEFSIAGNGIDVTCPACRGTFRVTARAEAPMVELARARVAKHRPAPGEPSMTCPKCDDEQPPRPACRSCGLLADRMADFVRDRDAKVPAEVTAAWDAVGTSWEDEAAHDRFVRAVSTALAYPWAAQRYRDALRLRSDDPIATEQLARLGRMAEATLLVTSGKKRDGGGKDAQPYKKVLIMFGALVVIAILGIFFTLMLTRNAEDERDHGSKPSKAVKRRDAGPARP